MGGVHPALAHLGYDRYDSYTRLFTKSVWSEGAPAALKKYNDVKLADTTRKMSEDQMNELGYYLMHNNRLDDAIAIFTQNTVDHPNSWNVWDSLGEAFMNKGNKELAIKYYERSLELNPGSKKRRCYP